MKSPARTDYSMTASPGSALPVAVRGEGCWIEDADGRRYLDACGGAMVMLLGHCHPRVVEALRAQAGELTFTYRFSFRNEPMLDLAERIARVAPGDLEWCFFNSSGSEANESALHLAVLYWELQGRAGKVEFLSRVTSYHGSTMGALSLSGSRWRAPFELLLRKYAVVPNSDTRRGGRGGARGRDPLARRRPRRRVLRRARHRDRPARRCRCPTATSRPCARCATATRSCSSPTRSSPPSGAPDAGLRSSTATPCPTSSRSERASAAASCRCRGWSPRAGCGR